MSANGMGRPAAGAGGRGWVWRSAASVAVIVGLSTPGAPARADDTRVIEQMKEQIQDLQIKINALLDAQKKMQDAQQKAAPAKGANQVVNGTDKIKLAISGQIDRGVLYFDDGAENNFFNVDNGNSSTRIRFIGTAKPDDDLTISTNLEFDLRSNASDRIDQTQENTGVDADTLFRIRRASISVGSATYGKFTIGQDKAATDDIAEIDLSGTSTAGESAITDLGGNLFFRNSAHVNGRRMSQIFGNFDGGRDDLIRYDTPAFGGFSASADFAQGGMYETALRFDSTKEYPDLLGGTKIQAGIGYANVEDKTNNPPNNTSFDDQVVGSVSVLTPVGISVTLAGGERFSTLDACEDPTNYYAKLGYQAQWFSFGKTAIAAEYGRTFDLTDNGDDGEVFGFQALQNIDDWAMEIFAAYRHFNVEQGNGFKVEDADLLFAGSRVKF